MGQKEHHDKGEMRTSAIPRRMHLRRIWQEIQREATRGSVIGFIAIYVLAASLLGLVTASTLSTEVYLEVAYVLMPLLFAPYAARLVTRDRERGYSSIASVNPLSRAEETISRIVFLASLVGVTLGLTGPITLFVGPPGGAAFEVRALHVFAWGFFVGTSSAIAGLVIGTSAGEKSGVAVGVGAAWSFVQFFVSENFSDITALGLPSSLVKALHLSPPLWALEATSPKYGSYASFPVGPIMGAGIVLAFHIAAYALVLGLQDRQGWIPRRAQRSWAIPTTALLAVLMLAVGAASAAPSKSSAVVSNRDYYYGLPAKFEGGNVTLSFQTQTGEPLFEKETGTSRYIHITRGENAIGVLTFHAAPNATLALTSLTGESPYVDLGGIPSIPPNLTMDPTGSAHLQLAMRPVPIIMFAPIAPVSFTFKVNGEVVRTASYFEYGPGDELDLENVPQWQATLAAGIVPSLAIGPLAIWLPRRLNQWS